MKRARILAVGSVAIGIFLATAIDGTIQASRHFDEPRGLIRGRVRDAARPVNGLKVSVKSATMRREVIINSSGDYEMELPADVYTITATLPEYYPYRRAPFRVRPGTVTIINLNLILIGIDRVHGGGKDLKYEKLSVPNAADQKLDALVAYNDRKEDERYIEYEGIRLYYDALAVHALNLQLDKRDFTFKATGNVHVDDGQQSDVYVRRADIGFLGSNPTIHSTFGAVARISGKGSIDNDNMSFEFVGEKDKTGRITYQDERRGISFSAEFWSFRVIDDDANEVEFTGSVKANILMGKEEVPGRYYPAIGFTVTVQDRGSDDGDTFSIVFHSVTVLKRSGTLSKGNIEVYR